MHPYSDPATITFDLTTGRKLDLQDLFLPNTPFLETIADYCMIYPSKPTVFLMIMKMVRVLTSKIIKIGTSRIRGY